MIVYGYTRISTRKQSIERQIRNIEQAYPEAKIIQEVYTGTKFQGREKFEKLLRKINSGDTIIFDSVSRMSRNAEEGFTQYEQLYNMGINLIFLKEPHINTDVYKQAMQQQVQLTGGMVDAILRGINEYLLLLAKEQIRLAFEQAQKEVDDLRKRTSEGLQTARMNGKQIGQIEGNKLTIKKEAPAKEIILKHNRSFGGTLNDEQTMKLAQISRKTYYKYKKEIREEELQ